MLRRIILAAAVLVMLAAGAACTGAESGSTRTVVSRPLAPAPVDGSFRQDSANAVGATGRPQLIEFYAPT